MLHEALVAAEGLAERGELSLRVVAMPWLNRCDADWLAAEIGPFEQLFVLEDHAPVGGLGDGLRAALPGRVVTVFGVEGWPACGSPDEALRHHGLDGASLAVRIAAGTGRHAGSAASSAAR
jgi:transketolase